MRRPIMFLGKYLTRQDEQLAREERERERLETRIRHAQAEILEAEARRLRGTPMKTDRRP